MSESFYRAMAARDAQQPEIMASKSTDDLLLYARESDVNGRPVTSGQYMAAIDELADRGVPGFVKSRPRLTTERFWNQFRPQHA